MSTTDTPAKLTHNEEIKAAIPTLAGTIASTIADPAADHFSEDDNQFLKFHGSYQQDDRDLRKTQKKFIMMIRGRIPGGVMTAKQWCVFDDLATDYGNNTLRITTRQSIQFHGVLKGNLRPLIAKINESLLSTLAADHGVRDVYGVRIDLPLSREEMAGMIGTAQETVIRQLSEFKQDHLIRLDGRRITVLDQARLLATANPTN
ncbi:MAG: helix-turn-helix domain-containing protein [Thermoanaerobaculia bacterium]|nr:helix-turn-helix domain-containing protein [Thermoanaerobaculia bacterium]